MSKIIDIDNENEKQPAKNGTIEHEKLLPEKQTPLPEYAVTRKVFLLEDINTTSGYEQKDKSYVHGVSESYRKFSFLQFLYNIIPVLKWLPKYSIKKQLPGDVTSGITVAVMHIPQGMAYGILAGVSPSSGLYMAFFPTLVYFALGTSRHISVGTLSVVSLMTLNVVNKHVPATTTQVIQAVSNLTTPLPLDGDLTQLTNEIYTPMQVVTAAAFMCGIYQVLMSIFKLGNLSSLLSDSLINGFTTGSAVHVVVSQLKDFFGIKLKRHNAAFGILHTVYDCILSIPKSNMNTLTVSLSVLIFMIFMNEIVKPRASKLCRFPIPAELIAVVGGTLISYCMQLKENYNVHLVGDIPLGLPDPVFPPVSLLSKVAFDSIAISIVGYSVSMSMGMLLAQKRNYEVRPNQEMLAIGVSNLVGGCFSCVPNSCSLSRSLIQEQTGGSTQLASVVSSFLILIILLWIGPFFEYLPRCVLSAIILVALKGMLFQALDLKKYYREGKMEVVTWIVTFIAVVLVDVDVGLIFGLCVSLVALYIKGWKSECAILGVVPGTDIYVDMRTHSRAEELANIKIFRYIGSINFASRSNFKKMLYKTIRLKFKSRRRASLMNTAEESTRFLGMQAVVVDLSNVTHMDVAACKTCTELKREFAEMKVKFILTSPNDRVNDAFEHAQALGEGPFTILPTVHDAVLYAKVLIAEINSNSNNGIAS